MARFFAKNGSLIHFLVGAPILFLGKTSLKFPLMIRLHSNKGNDAVLGKVHAAQSPCEGIRKDRVVHSQLM